MSNIAMGGFIAGRCLLLACCLGLQACGDGPDKPGQQAAVPDTAASSVLAAAAASCKPAARPAPPPATPAPALAAAPSAAAKATPCGLCVQDNPRLAAGADGLAATTLRQCNETAAAIPLALSVSDFSTIGWDGQPFALHSSRRLKAENPAEQPILDGKPDLAVKACIDVHLDVGALSQAGAMTAQLRQGAQDLATLTAFRTALPLAVKVDGPNPAQIDLALVKGGSAVVRLRNDDGVAYRLRWRLELAGRAPSGCLTLLPKRTQALTLALDDEAFGGVDSGFIRPARQEGRLVLERDVDPVLANLPLQPLVLPVSATLRYHVEWLQGLVNLFSVALFLLLGILGSLALNYALPMQRRRVALKQGLAAHEDSLNSQGDLIGSRPLNVLRVELARLRAAVGAQWPFLPETEAELPRIEARLGALQKRIELARQAGKLLADVRDPAALAVHEAQAVTGHCGAALRAVQMASPTDVDLQTAQTRLDSAAALVEAAAAPPDAAALLALADRVAQLPVTLGALPADPSGGAATPADSATWQTLEDLLADLRQDFARLAAAAAAGAGAAATPSRADYIQAAEAVWKAEALLAFATMLRNAESPAVYRSRLDRAKDLLATLVPGPQHSTRLAQRLLREIRQNVSRADVLAAIQLPAGAGPSIVVEPPAPTEYQLTVLRVSLPAPGLDVAEARRSIVCKWAVDGREIPGNEFSVCHFFELPGLRTKAFTVSVSLVDGAATVATLAPVQVTLTSGPLLHSSTWLSLASMATTAIIVTVGLLATAQEKLLATDVQTGVFALLALGFGADVLKRVLSKP
jgi:hypothetical protein